jgi:hypothetical protein
MRLFHMSRHWIRSCPCLAGSLCVLGFGLIVLSGANCPAVPVVPVDTAGPYHNTTDSTNRGATFVGSAACGACHSNFNAAHALHGHANALTAISGQAPDFPASIGAGLPDPPDGFDWQDISYVIGGTRRRARFLDLNGFILTSGTADVDTQWNLAFPANGTSAGFVAFAPTEMMPLPFDFETLRSLTTGSMMQDAAAPISAENRPGIRGTFAEPGVQCESCHGPGSNHLPAPGRRDLFVDSQGAESCNECHSVPFAAKDVTPPAVNGFVAPMAQHQELLASGGHSGFSCTFCHDPHVSVTFDRSNAIRNACTACHSGMNMALHDGKVFTRGDYSEPLSCESCHMPFAVREASNAADAIVGDVGRMGDTRSHIFRINPANADFTTMFSDDMMSVRLDDEGRAAATIDFVCFRCHNGIGAFSIRADVAADVALEMHTLPGAP